MWSYEGNLNTEVLKEMSYKIADLRDHVQENLIKLSPEQRDVFDFVTLRITQQKGAIVFLDAPGGTGNTFLLNLWLAYVRNEGQIALAVASSGIASTLLEGLLGFRWEEWWTYDGISGPNFWGRINPEWSLCLKGRRQSPVNLEPAKLLFDPNLRVLDMDKLRVSGTLSNTGHSVLFKVHNSTKFHVNFTGGPLSYRYLFDHIVMHYGLVDEVGSEHTINGVSFPAELQIFGFNGQLYSNYSEAVQRAQGIAAISVLLQLGDLSNPELRLLTDNLDQIRHGGEEVEVRRLSIHGLLPDTDFYMTYDGSTTAPPCHETVVWLILNKPIYITKQQLHAFRRLMQAAIKDPKAPLGNNYRPPQPLHHRPIRTNIDFSTNQGGAKQCPSMYKEVYYKANNWKLH